MKFSLAEVCHNSIEENLVTSDLYGTGGRDDLNTVEKVVLSDLANYSESPWLYYEGRKPYHIIQSIQTINNLVRINIKKCKFQKTYKNTKK